MAHGDHAAVSASSARAQAALGNALGEMVRRYADGRVTEAERYALSDCRERLSALLALRESPLLALLPDDVRARLEAQLFEPLAVLDGAAPTPEVFTRPLTRKQRRQGRKRATASSIIRAGGAETRDRIERAFGRTATGGLYTTRGPTLREHGMEYKPYNEDAAALGVIPASKTKSRKELIFAGAFDQAGGMGQIPGQTGGASRLMAEAFEQAAQDIAKGEVDPLSRLHQAILSTHGAINALNEANAIEAMTTASMGVMRDGLAYVVNCGDAKTYHYNRAGQLLGQTRSHNLGDQTAEDSGNPNAGLNVSNIITTGVGGDGTPSVDGYTWEVRRGDVLLFVSDGVADANLEAQRTAWEEGGAPWTRHNGEVTAEQVGELVAEGGEGPEMTARVADWAMKKVIDRDAKPDNTSVVAVVVS